LDHLFEHLKGKNKAKRWKKGKYEWKRAFEVIFVMESARKFSGAI